jgi:hypothetical protein
MAEKTTPWEVVNVEEGDEQPLPGYQVRLVAIVDGRPRSVIHRVTMAGIALVMAHAGKNRPGELVGRRVHASGDSPAATIDERVALVLASLAPEGPTPVWDVPFVFEGQPAIACVWVLPEARHPSLPAVAALIYGALDLGLELGRRPAVRVHDADTGAVLWTFMSTLGLDSSVLRRAARPAMSVLVAAGPTPTSLDALSIEPLLTGTRS